MSNVLVLVACFLCRACCICLACALIVCVSVSLYFFFFKQKTAYEMRISDWSSDVCSSDLLLAMAMAMAMVRAVRAMLLPILLPAARRRGLGLCAAVDDLVELAAIEPHAAAARAVVDLHAVARGRSGGRRVGKAGDSSGRSGGEPYT